MIIRSSSPFYWSRRILLLLLIVLFITTVNATIDFSECYINGQPHRCEPNPETFSFRKTPIVNSTCGSPSTEYCLRNETDFITCGFSCDSLNDHPPEDMTDFFPQLTDRRTWWQSANNLSSPVLIRISLGARVQVQAITFQFVSLKPDSFYIRKSNDSITYTDYHYFSRNCLTEYKINPKTPNLVSANETAILCREITSSTPGQISFVPTLHRPSSTDVRLGLSNKLYNFTTATDIEVILVNYSSDASNISESFYALEDLSVVGKCQCNGHASQCNITDDGKRVCDCKHNTTGDYCERCADLYVDVPWQVANGSEPFECVACNCSGFADTCIFDQELYDLTGSGGRCMNCTNNTMGPRCEECADNYTRASDGSCVPCQCNGLAVMCDKNNGTCINCTDNTEGDMCQNCTEGYYNHIINEGCSRCPCPSTDEDGGQYSDTCILNNGTVLCTNCSEGHEGDNCEYCAPGYYGDPTGNPSTPCLKCMCNGNINTSDEMSCDNVTGQCLDCLNNTTGDMCQLCEPGYYGDAIGDEKCTDCECNSTGSTGINCTSDGKCYCLPNVIGLKCDQCDDNHYNFSSGYGCQPCDCHMIGSNDTTQCNLTSGQCTCKPGVTGRQCDRCESGYYGLDYDGCKICECNDQALTCVAHPVTDFECINCKSNRVGPYCEQCDTFYYPQLNISLNSSDYCQECDCHLPGVIDNDQDCVRNGSNIGQCSCKANVEGRDCSVCKDGYFNLEGSNPEGCTDCGCHRNLSVSHSCNSNGVCTCIPNVTGDKCESCLSGYYIFNGTCIPCNCNVGGALSNECREDGQCICRTGITGLTCSEVLPGYFTPYIDHYTYEAEDSSGLLNLSYRLPGSGNNFTGAGYAAITVQTQVISFGQFTPPISGEYELIIRYMLNNTWGSAALRIAPNNAQGTGPPISCNEYTPSMGDLEYDTWPIGVAQAVVRRACLRGGRTYNISLNSFDFTQPSILEVDSLVIQLYSGDGLVTLNDTLVREEYSNCLSLMRSRSNRTQEVLDRCQAVSFAVLTEAHNGSLECNCYPRGSLNSSCQSYGGQCYCRGSYIGRACDSCAAGSYSPILGCLACTCDPNGSIEHQFCDRITGQCNCFPHVLEPYCTACEENYFNISSGMGCSPCDCDPNGSSDPQCNRNNGTCTCICGVTGDKCNTCNEELYNFPVCDQCNCSPAGAHNNNCNYMSGQCSCRDNTMGQTCDTCINGTFNLHVSNPSGCQPCYCSGLTTECSSAEGYFYSEISTHFVGNNNDGWTLSNDRTLIDGLVENTLLTTYLIAPSKFLGNRLSSYVQYLRINVTVNGQPILNNNNFDIRIKSGNNVTLFGVYGSQLVTGNQLLSVQLHESAGWLMSPNNTPSSSLLQSVLIDLSSIRIRASLSDVDTIFHSIALDSVSMSGGEGEEVSWVESCVCPSPAYTGLSCEECADNYTRASDGSCVPCQCNGLAVMCDKNDGTCINCTGNTEGDMCQYCSEGYYNHTINEGCSRCPCPSTDEDGGQYSNTCILNNGIVMCTNCSEGHEGDNCEYCAPGYYGDPTGTETGQSTPCRDCMCNGNIDTSDPDSCNMTTGICVKCINNTAGDMCQWCKPGYYGDAIVAKNCTDCECDSTGSTGINCTSDGKCDCLPNVIGLKCDQCDHDHYNFSSGFGCQPCDCHMIGSNDTQCDLTSGQCTCKPGVTGRQCDRCESGYYGLDDDGCKKCNCSTIGSVSEQCDSEGICTCKDDDVKGDKCDVCDENRFQNATTGLCDNCSSCYDDIQSDVNDLRSHYLRTRTSVNEVADRNDPTTTFERKQSYAVKLVNDLYLKVIELNETFANYTSETTNVTVILKLLQENISEIEASRLTLERHVSPIVTFSLVSKELMNKIKENLYKSLSLLKNLNSSIISSANNTYMSIMNNASEANQLLQNANLHIANLQSELETLSILASNITIQANDSLQVAWRIVSDYQVAVRNLTDLENETDFLNSTNEFIKNGFVLIEEFIASNRSSLNETKNLLAMLDIPSISFIEGLQNNVTSLEMRQVTINTEISTLTSLLMNLNSSLNDYNNDFALLSSDLNTTIASIEWYYNELNTSYNRGIVAQSSGQSCINTAESILSELISFNTTISQLRNNANDVLVLSANIQSDVVRVNDIVDDTTDSLQNISDRLSSSLDLARQALNMSRELVMVSNELHTNSSNLLNQTRIISNDTSNAINNSLQLLQASSDSLTELDDLQSNITDINDIISQPDISQLTNNAAQTRSNAIASLTRLNALFLSTPTPNVSLIYEIESIIDSISNQFNATDVLALTNTLEDQLINSLELELADLRLQLLEIERETNKLRNILDTLPVVDCT